MILNLISTLQNNPSLKVMDPDSKQKKTIYLPNLLAKYNRVKELAILHELNPKVFPTKILPALENGNLEVFQWLKSLNSPIVRDLLRKIYPVMGTAVLRPETEFLPRNRDTDEDDELLEMQKITKPQILKILLDLGFNEIVDLRQLLYSMDPNDNLDIIEYAIEKGVGLSGNRDEQRLSRNDLWRLTNIPDGLTKLQLVWGPDAKAREDLWRTPRPDAEFLKEFVKRPRAKPIVEWLIDIGYLLPNKKLNENFQP